MDNLSKKVVCWIDWEEWKDVYKWIYSNERNDQIRAINRIAAWRSRGRLPLGVEATSSITEILCHKEDRSENERAMSLAMAINRLVNGVLESGQTTQANTSMFSRAARMNLPHHFVEIRHEAAHGMLPSIRTLTGIANTALTWLDDFYWKTQMTQLNEYKTKLKQMLDDFVNDFKQQNFTKQTTQDHWMVSRVRTLTQDISGEITAGLLESVLVPVLIEDGYLIPTGTSHPKGDYTLPTAIKNMWSPIVKSLHVKYTHFLTILMFLLVDRITRRSTSSTTRLMAAWLIHLLRDFDFKKQIELNMELPYRFIFERCLRSRQADASIIVETVAPMLSTKDQKTIQKKGSKLIDPSMQYQSKTGRWRFIDWWIPCPIGVAPTDSSIPLENQKGLDLPDTINSKDNVTLVQCIQNIENKEQLKQNWLDNIKSLYPDLINGNIRDQSSYSSLTLPPSVTTTALSTLPSPKEEDVKDTNKRELEIEKENNKSIKKRKNKKQKVESIVSSEIIKDDNNNNSSNSSIISTTDLDNNNKTGNEPKEIENNNIKKPTKPKKKKPTVGSKVDLLQFWK